MGGGRREEASGRATARARGDEERDSGTSIEKRWMLFMEDGGGRSVGRYFWKGGRAREASGIVIGPMQTLHGTSGLAAHCIFPSPGDCCLLAPGGAGRPPGRLCNSVL